LPAARLLSLPLSLSHELRLGFLGWGFRGDGRLRETKRGQERGMSRESGGVPSEMETPLLALFLLFFLILVIVIFVLF